jgi:hypothetical protein
MENPSMSRSIDHLFPEIAASRRRADHSKPSAKNRPKNSRARNACLAVGGVLICIFFVLLFIPVVLITPESCARIKPGMTKTQVEAILGGPPDWYDGVGGVQFGAEAPIGKGEAGLDWLASDGDLVVLFDGNGCVVKADFYHIQVLDYDLWSLVVERLTRCTLISWDRWWHDEVWPGRA